MVLIDMGDCFTECTTNKTSLVNGSVPRYKFLVYSEFVESIEDTLILRFQYFETLNLVQCYMTIIVSLHLSKSITSEIIR